MEPEQRHHRVALREPLAAHAFPGSDVGMAKELPLRIEHLDQTCRGKVAQIRNLRSISWLRSSKAPGSQFALISLGSPQPQQHGSPRRRAFLPWPVCRLLAFPAARV